MDSQSSQTDGQQNLSEAPVEQASSRAGSHDYELHLNSIPSYHTELTLAEELRKIGLTRFRRVHKAHGWNYAFVNFEVCLISLTPLTPTRMRPK